MNEAPHTWRCYTVMGALLFALMALGVRLAHFHLWIPAPERERIVKLRQVEKHLLVRRGVICDRRGDENILALDLDAQDVCVDPQVILKQRDVNHVASLLASVLETDPAPIARQLDRPHRRFAYISRFADATRVAKLQGLGLDGLFFQDCSLRQYPYDAFMCHVLGFSNYAGYGAAGVELSMDRYLRGSPGVFVTEVDGLRNDRYLRRSLRVPAKDGAHVQLTLDMQLQYFVERALDQAMHEHSARASCAIVEDVRTGEILAMASRPAFDLNDFTEANEDAELNRAIGSTYEPGSTLKTIAVAAALEQHLVTPATIFDCEHGSWVHAGRILRDHHPYDRLSVADILKKSSNIGTAKIALKLGPDRLYDYLRRFGMGDRLKLDLPGEETGILHPVKEWSGLSCSRIAIGQGIAVTALQMIGLYSAIANGGVLMKPYVVQRVVSNDGLELRVTVPEEIGRPISPETAAVMRELLSRVTDEGGTGRRASLDDMEVAGKTGTAQKPENGGYSDRNYTASFVGFLPADDPRISIIVVIDEPQPYHTGGVVAAPAFREIAEQAIRYLHIPNSPTRVAIR